MTNDLISRSGLLAKSIRVTETDEGGWERVLRAVPVEEIEKAEAVDAEPVVYGEFVAVRVEHIPFITATVKRCKTCGTEFVLLFRGPTMASSFCPRCGARKKEADNAQE